MKSFEQISKRLISSATAMLAFVIFVGIFASASTAQAKKLLIVTDEPGGKKAWLIKNKIMTMQPFGSLSSSEFTIEIKQLDKRGPQIECKPKVIKYTETELVSVRYYAAQNGVKLTSADEAKYKAGYTIDRLVDCDKAGIARIGAQYQADQMLFVHNNPNQGGSGGDIPIILSGSIPGVGIHEWLHTFGLADEYAYTTSQEAALYCADRHWVNVAMFNDAPPYRSSDDVRTRHRDVIPWLSEISNSASLVTGEQLGTPSQQALGIFPSKTCTKLNGKLKSWKVSREETIMENTYSSYLPKAYWPPILRELGVSNKRIETLMKTAQASIGFSGPQ